MAETAVIIGVGAYRGLGAAVARRFAAEGMHVVLAGRTGERLRERAEEIEAAGGTASICPTDVRTEEAVRALFDFAEPSLVTGKRDTTTVPSQALYLMNSGFVTRRSEGFAERLLELECDDPRRIDHAYELALGRLPNDKERRFASEFFQEFKSSIDGDDSGDADSQREAAWSAFCQALFAAAEFRYRD